MSKCVFEERTPDGKVKTTTVKKYNLPFFNYTTTKVVDSDGTKRTEREFSMVTSTDELKRSCYVTLGSTLGFSWFCKGLASLIKAAKEGKK